MARGAPLDILNSARAASLAYAQRTSNTSLKALMKRAQADLNRRLRQLPPNDKSFTAAQLRSTLAQVEHVLQATKQPFIGQLVAGTDEVAKHATKATLRYLGQAEAQFTGVAGEGLGLNTAAVMDTAVSGTRASVLRRIMSDPNHPGRPGIMDRYGEAVVGHFERTLQTSLVAGTPWEDVRQQLIDSSPFLQQAPMHWAERIVRTEYMGAHNQAGHNAMQEVNQQTDGGMIRILCATFDNRTGSDSIAYHGQIRRMDEPFDAWGGEQYMTPPNRPNDREVVVPHHMEWPIPDELHPKSDSMVAQRWREEGRKGSPPARPKLTTVPLGDIGKPIPVQPPATEQPPTPQHLMTGEVVERGARGRILTRPRVTRGGETILSIREREMVRNESEISESPELSGIRERARAFLAASADDTTLNEAGEIRLSKEYRATVYNVSAVQKAALRILGREFKNGDYAGLLNLKELQGVQFVSGKLSGYPNGFGLESKFETPNPPAYEREGTVSRRYLVDEAGRRTVMHDFFAMPESLRDNGMGAKLIEGQFRNYKKMGIDRVETHAAWDGQYVWPSMGFQLMNPEELGPLKQQFAKWAQGERQKVDRKGERVKELALSAPVDTRPLLDALATVKNITDLANLKINGVPAGKEFLRWRGHTNAGPLINLEINLKDKPQWSRMDKYFKSLAAKRKTNPSK